MATNSEMALLSDEAQKGDILGIVKLRNINSPTKPEASARGLNAPRGA